MRRSRGILASVSLMVGLVGCAPADVAGDYTVNVTNGENGCEVDNWTVGESSSAIPLVITQDGGTAQVVVRGPVATFYLQLLAGSNVFNGDVAGDRITAELIGSNAFRQGDCSYTVTVDLDATLSGDLLEGELAYRAVTNGHADCGILETCRNRQRFNGTRPPSAE